MARRRQSKRRTKPRGRRASAHVAAAGGEWVGGRLQLPVYITETEPFRPEIILWLEVPDGLIVSHALIAPDGPPVSFGGTLRDAMRSPAIGPPRRPARVRVADAAIAAEVHAVAPEIEVRVAPTPELDEVLQSFVEHRDAAGPDAGLEEASYLEAGRVSTDAVGRLFRAAELLYRIAPWKVAGDHQVLRVDIPRLGIEGGCLSIIGRLGESLGFILFPSLVAYGQFLDAAEQSAAGGPLDIGTTALALDYERGAELPASMRKEIAEHGWPVAGPRAYPVVHHRDRDGMPRPLTAKDFAIVTACATSLAAFFAKHRELFSEDAELEPISESYFDDDDLEVRFTAPYEAGPDFGLSVSPAARTAAPGPRPPRRKAKPDAGAAGGRVGRNQPCPCGSGEKYKRCCLADAAAARSAGAAPASVHELDGRLTEDMMRFAARKFGDAWGRAQSDFDDPEASAQLFGPWAVYHCLVEGRPVVDWYLEAKKRQLSGSELRWLQAQRASWLSVWEVLDVDPGRSITLGDLLSGEERTVIEVRGSKTIARRDAVLGRVVDHDGISVLGGSHPRPLPPMDAAEVVRRVRGRLRRKRAVPVDRLQDEKIGRYMIARWEEAVDERDERRLVPPRLQNTDGEELLFTVDHFALEPARREQVAQALAGLDGVDPPASGDRDQAYVFSRSGTSRVGGMESPIIGRAAISEDALRLETNSVARADALRARIEAACGDALRHRAREHSDPFALLQERMAAGVAGLDADEPAAGDGGIPPEEAARVILGLKRKHYATWADEPLPALDGKTARQAVRTRAGREQVDLLLKDCENREAREPAAQRYDFSKLRDELGL